MEVSGRFIGNDHPVFIVAEIGQNHQGSLEIAKEMILKAKEIGVDCVKFQKSSLPDKFTRQALDRPYVGANSWGATYGEHKTFMEFSLQDYHHLSQFCQQNEILFSASAMDPVSLQQLMAMNLPFIKIGSGDADNIPLLQEAASSESPFIVSTGMQRWPQVQRIYELFRHKPTALLHCVSAYPTPPAEAHLKLIPLYKRAFPELVIGYSGHELGLQLTVASVLLGARVVERHFTLDKQWKGTDHKASLDPKEFARLVGYIRAVEGVQLQERDIYSVLAEVMDAGDLNSEELDLALQDVSCSSRSLLPSEIACHSKLGKSLVFGENLLKGHILTVGDVAVKVSEPHGLSPTCYEKIIGRKLTRDCCKDNPVLELDLQE